MTSQWQFPEHLYAPQVSDLPSSLTETMQLPVPAHVHLNVVFLRSSTPPLWAARPVGTMAKLFRGSFSKRYPRLHVSLWAELLLLAMMTPPSVIHPFLAEGDDRQCRTLWPLKRMEK
jgi:hypothetical protein